MVPAKKIIPTVILVGFPHFGLSGQDSSTLSITPSISYAQLGQSFSHSIGFGLTISHSLSSWVGVGIAADFAPTKVEYDLVGGVGSVEADVTVVQARCELLIAQFQPAFDLYGSIGAGFLHTRTGETQVSLGALGKRTVPSRRETVGAYSLGFLMEHYLSTRVGIRVEPKAVLFDENSSLQSYVFITGGICIGIL